LAKISVTVSTSILIITNSIHRSYEAHWLVPVGGSDSGLGLHIGRLNLRDSGLGENQKSKKK
jgi:hypothetical protein